MFGIVRPFGTKCPEVDGAIDRKFGEKAVEEFTYLIPIKKSKKAPQQGDVFVVQPFQNIFYYGKVIQTNIYIANSLSLMG